MTSFLDRGGVTGGMFLGKRGDGAVEGNEFVGLEVALQLRIAGCRGCDVLKRGYVQGDLMFAAHSGEAQQHVETGRGLWRLRREGYKSVSVFGVATLGVTHRAINMQASNILVGIGLRQGNPEMGGTGGIRVGGNMHLIGKFK